LWSWRLNTVPNLLTTRLSTVWRLHSEVFFNNPIEHSKNECNVVNFSVCYIQVPPQYHILPTLLMKYSNITQVAYACKFVRLLFVHDSVFVIFQINYIKTTKAFENFHKTYNSKFYKSHPHIHLVIMIFTETRTETAIMTIRSKETKQS